MTCSGHILKHLKWLLILHHPKIIGFRRHIKKVLFSILNDSIAIFVAVFHEQLDFSVNSSISKLQGALFLKNKAKYEYF